MKCRSKLCATLWIVTSHLYSLFKVLLGPDDAVLSDELNHASIIDGIRLCRAKRFRYKHMDLKDLEEKLRESQVSFQSLAWILCCMI